MKQRTLTAIAFVAVMMAGIYASTLSFLILFSLVALGCLWELLGLLLPAEEGHHALRRLLGTLVGGLALALPTYARFGGLGEGAPLAADWPFLLPLLLALLALVELFGQAREPFRNLGHYALGILYIALPIAMLFDFASLADYHPHRVFAIIWLIWTNDTMAYLIGSKLGKNKLFERISPKKTWEGTLGGALCAVLMAWLISHYVPDLSPAQWLGLGLVVGVFGTLGDLVESMLKRSIGVKDSGDLLPGHGGLLDRFDSFLFVLPFVWLVLRVF
jgi:phosphatidate cytidylyltransferase